MNDRQLLELAAKAFGINLEFHQEMSGDFPVYLVAGGFKEWNPLLRVEDGLGLAIKLSIKVRWHDVLNQALAWPPLGTEIKVNGEDCGNDPITATLRAIVQAAAAIGATL